MSYRGFLFLVAALCCAQDGKRFSLVGTVVNSTDPNKPVAAPIQMVFNGDGSCAVTISPPLQGSGACTIKVFNEKSGRIEIASTGGVDIEWTGFLKGNFASGSYQVNVGAQSGSFYLAMVAQNERSGAVKSQPMQRVIPRSEAACVPAIETSIKGEFHGWDGETLFKLDNGQIWQQAEYDYTYSYSYHPTVTIYQTSIGCRLKVEDENETIIVKRIK